jgi:hypothetical protein
MFRWSKTTSLAAAETECDLCGVRFGIGHGPIEERALGAPLPHQALTLKCAQKREEFRDVFLKNEELNGNLTKSSGWGCASHTVHCASACRLLLHAVEWRAAAELGKRFSAARTKPQNQNAGERREPRGITGRHFGFVVLLQW